MPNHRNSSKVDLDAGSIESLTCYCAPLVYITVYRLYVYERHHNDRCPISRLLEVLVPIATLTKL